MKQYNYKSYTIVQIITPDGEKWYNIFKAELKVNEKRDMRTLVQAKQFINNLEG